MQNTDVVVATNGATAKTEALSWLASQLRWERTLDTLRDEDVDEHPKAA